MYRVNNLFFNSGQKGTTGITGLKGDIGPLGLAGSKGEQGLTGAKGEQGLVGGQGIQGPKGDQGIRGLQGGQGQKGIITCLYLILKGHSRAHANFTFMSGCPLFSGLNYIPYSLMGRKTVLRQCLVIEVAFKECLTVYIKC